jgi:hypothetical protein
MICMTFQYAKNALFGRFGIFQFPAAAVSTTAAGMLRDAALTQHRLHRNIPPAPVRDESLQSRAVYGYITGRYAFFK